MPSHEAERGRKTLMNTSRSAVNELARMLKAMISRRVGAPPEEAEEARELVGLLQALQKILADMVKVEQHVAKLEAEREPVRAEVTIEGTAFELDLDGARGELLAELGRLHAEIEDGA